MSYVQKILEPGEELPREWPVEGTVGYEFGALLNGVFVDSRNERAFTNLYERFTGSSNDIETLIYQSKKLILNIALSGKLNVLVHLLEDLRSLDRHARDFTPMMLRDSLREAVFLWSTPRATPRESSGWTRAKAAFASSLLPASSAAAAPSTGWASQMTAT